MVRRSKQRQRLKPEARREARPSPPFNVDPTAKDAGELLGEASPSEAEEREPERLKAGRSKR